MPGATSRTSSGTSEVWDVAPGGWCGGRGGRGGQAVRDAGSDASATRNAGGDGGEVARLHRRDGGPAEAAAGHPGAARAGGPRRLHDDVELGRADLVVVAQRRVRGVHERPHVADPAGVEQGDELLD